MNRTMTVKTLFLLLVMWMPLAVPCHAAWDDDDDDFYDYYTYEEWDDDDEYDEEDWGDGWDNDDGNNPDFYYFYFDSDGDGINDWCLTTDSDGHGVAISYMDDEDFIYESLRQSGDDSDNGWEDSGNDGSEANDGSNSDGDGEETGVGAIHPNNNNAEIIPPLSQPSLHVPVEDEVLFKDGLPAQSLKQAYGMDCVPTAMANLLSHIGSEQSAVEMRNNILLAYYNMCNGDVTGNANINGIAIERIEAFMSLMNFDSISFNDVISYINSGSPSLAIIETDAGAHMVEIVGYYQDGWNSYTIDAYQCINPGTGEYETHYSYEFEKYKTYIYIKY